MQHRPIVWVAILFAASLIDGICTAQTNDSSKKLRVVRQCSGKAGEGCDGATLQRPGVGRAPADVDQLTALTDMMYDDIQHTEVFIINPLTGLSKNDVKHAIELVLIRDPSLADKLWFFTVEAAYADLIASGKILYANKGNVQQRQQKPRHYPGTSPQIG